MKKAILLSFIIFISTLSSFAIDCEYTFKMGGREYCSIKSNDYDLKSYKYDKKTNTYSINMIHDMMDSNSHQEYKSPRNGKYITHLIHKVYYKDGKINVKCIGYITGDIKPIYENGRTVSMEYVNLKTFMEQPNSIKNIKEFEDMYSRDYDGKIFEIIIKTMADSH